MAHDERPVVVHRLPMGISNAFLLESPGGLVLVDAGLPARQNAVLGKMAEIGRRDLRLIYITHAHIDHYGSAAALRRLTGAPIAVHPFDAGDMASGQTRLGAIRNWQTLSSLALPFIERLLTVEPAPPDLTLAEGDRLDEHGLAARVVHTPGHTPGSTTLLLDNGIALVGDLASATGGAHAQRSYAVDWSLVATSLAKVQALRPTLVYTGHGRQPIAGADFQKMSPAISLATAGA